MNIHIGTNLPSPSIQLLTDLLLDGIEFGWGIEIQNPEQIDVLVSGRPTRNQLAVCTKLKKLIVPFAGIPEATFEVLKEFSKVDLHNLHHNAVPVAELAIALMLAASKYIVPFDQRLRSGDWSPRYEPPKSMLVSNKSVLILGYGAIGKQIAQMCMAFGMEVLAVRKSVHKSSFGHGNVRVYPVDELESILPKAQFLINALPLTTDTINFLDKDRLSLLPKGCILVNIGRGQTIHEESLFTALSNGDIAAAALDVWYSYPENSADRVKTYPSTLPIYTMENVVLSPHRGGATVETEILRYKAVAELINAYFSGLPMPNLVDVERGY